MRLYYKIFIYFFENKYIYQTKKKGKRKNMNLIVMSDSINLRMKRSWIVNKEIEVIQMIKFPTQKENK